MAPTSSSDYMKLDDHDHQSRPSFYTLSTHNTSYSNIQDQGSFHPRESHQQEIHKEAYSFASEGGSSNYHESKLCLSKNDTRQGTQIHGHRHHNIPTQWLPSKLRFIRKMMGSDQKDTEVPANREIKFNAYRKQGSSPTTENSSNGSSCTLIRVCSDCYTTKTPLWRSGPQGPKSLCNACGIRQRKARRALAIAAATANGTTLATVKPKVQQKEKKLKANTEIEPFKKRSRLGRNNVQKNINGCFDAFLISLSKKLAPHQVFPQDEKEAAILLMALSCNLVHG